MSDRRQLRCVTFLVAEHARGGGESAPSDKDEIPQAGRAVLT
jgi:hypothetical protein